MSMRSRSASARSHFGRANMKRLPIGSTRADVDMLGTTQQEACTYRLGYSLLQTGDRQKARDYFGRISRSSAPPIAKPPPITAPIDYADGSADRAL